MSGVEVLLGLYEKERSFRDNGCIDAWVFLAPTREVVGEGGRRAGGGGREEGRGTVVGRAEREGGGPFPLHLPPIHTYRHTKRETERNERERRDRQTNRQTDRERDRDRDRGRDIERRETDRHKQTQTDRDRDRARPREYECDCVTV